MALFPVKLGARNGGNARVLRGLTSGVFRDAFAGVWWWVQRVKFGDFALAGATSQEVAFATAYPGNPFPTNVVRKQPLIFPVTPLAGGTIASATVEMGDAADPNGIVEASNIFTGSPLLNTYVQTITAAEFARRTETAFAPSFTLRTTVGNVNAATAFDFYALIEFTPVANV